MTLAPAPVTRPRRTIRTLALAIASLAALAGWSAPGGAGVASAAGAAAVPGVQLVSTNPDDRTPVATNGEVRAIAEVGNTIVVGGTFTTIRDGGSSTNVARSYLFAYDKTTNVVNTAFAPTFNGSVDARYRGNFNICRDGLDVARLMSELRSVAFSAGSACASGSGRPSHVLQAIGLTDRQAKSTIRLGWGRYSTEEDIIVAARLINEAAEEIL